MNRKTIEHFLTFVNEHGVDCWWTMETQDLLPLEYRYNGNTTTTVEILFPHSQVGAMCVEPTSRMFGLIAAHHGLRSRRNKSQTCTWKVPISIVDGFNRLY